MPNKLDTALDAISAAMKYLAPPLARKELTSPAKRMRAYLGVTDDPREGGFILSNGEMVDMSGVGRDISDFPYTAAHDYGMRSSFEPGRRGLPHNVTQDVVDMPVGTFLDEADAVRFDAQETFMEASKVPTGRQRYRASEMALDEGMPLFMEAVDPLTQQYLGSKNIIPPTAIKIKGFYQDKLRRRGLSSPAQELLLLLDQAKGGMTKPMEERLNKLLDQLPDDAGALTWARR